MPAKKGSKKPAARESERFEPAKIESLFVVLDAVAWIDAPRSGQVAQFANVDPRTAGKLLKNARQIGLIEQIGEGYVLRVPYPYQGSLEQKQAVVREALYKLPLLVGVRQFLGLGNSLTDSLRKAATVANRVPYIEAELLPLVEWAKTLKALEPGALPEDLVDAATEAKKERHEHSAQKIAFLSHSSKDKPFIRQLAADLTASGVKVWVDEQRIRVGDSIPEKIAQGLAESDFFLIAVSGNSAQSEWVKKELNDAMVNEIERREVHVLPLKLDNSEMPAVIKSKKYADFSVSYKDGLKELLAAIKGDS